MTDKTNEIQDLMNKADTIRDRIKHTTIELDGIYKNIASMQNLLKILPQYPTTMKEHVMYHTPSARQRLENPISFLYGNKDRAERLKMASCDGRAWTNKEVDMPRRGRIVKYTEEVMKQESDEIQRLEILWNEQCTRIKEQNRINDTSRAKEAELTKELDECIQIGNMD